MPTLSFQAAEKEFNLFISELERLFCPCQPITVCTLLLDIEFKKMKIFYFFLFSQLFACIESLNSDWLVLATITQKQRQEEKNINHCHTTFCLGKSLGKLLCKTELKCSDELSSTGNSPNLNICCIREEKTFYFHP